jgi:hypothetical protein
MQADLARVTSEAQTALPQLRAFSDAVQRQLSRELERLQSEISGCKRWQQIMCSFAIINSLSMALHTSRNSQPSSLVSQNKRSDPCWDPSLIAHVCNDWSSKLDGIFLRLDLRMVRSQAIFVWESHVL